MTLEDLIKQHGGQAAFARLIGCDRASLNRIVKNHRPIGPAMALRIFKATGHRYGELADTPQPRSAA